MKRIFTRVGWVIYALFLLFMIVLMVNAIVCRIQNKRVQIFGYMFACVVTPSMEPEIHVGDFIAVKLCAIDAVTVGDDIVFVAGPDFAGGSIAGEFVVHRAVEVTDDGGIAVTTKGINNSSVDTGVVTAENFVGVCVNSSTLFGQLYSFVMRYGFIIFIAGVALPIIIKQVIRIIKIINEEESDAENEEGK